MDVISNIEKEQRIAIKLPYTKSCDYADPLKNV